MITELKVVWNEDHGHFYGLYRVNGETIKIRTGFFRKLVAEIFSRHHTWEFIAFGTEPIIEWTPEAVERETKMLLQEVELILGKEDHPLVDLDEFGMIWRHDDANTD